MRFDCLDASYQLIRNLRDPLVKIRRADPKLYTQLRTASKISVELRRRGKTVVMHYEIVP